MILLIETGLVDDDLAQSHGDYPQMFTRLFKAREIAFHVVALEKGDSLPNVDGVNGVVITGSRHGVYDGIAWIEPLKAFIQDAASRRVPMVGICFGHQIIAEALGGRVEKSDKGWGIGAMSYVVDVPATLSDIPQTMAIQAIHQDQVVEKPADAQTIASSEFCEFAGFVYGGDDPYAVTLQPHPEFSPDFVKDLITRRRGVTMPADRVDQALARIDAPLNYNAWGDWLADFLVSRRA